MSMKVQSLRAAPEVPGEQTCKYGETVELAKMPDVTDYRFSGWYSEDVALSGGSFTMPDHAVVIEGSFSQLNSYTVTYDLNGGTTTSSQTVFPGWLTAIRHRELRIRLKNPANFIRMSLPDGLLK